MEICLGYLRSDADAGGRGKSSFFVLRYGFRVTAMLDHDGCSLGTGHLVVACI